MAGRRLGYPLYIGTLSAVVLGGASTIGTASLAHENGISGMWLVLMIGLRIVAPGALLSTRLSNLGVYTVSEMLELRCGARRLPDGSHPPRWQRRGRILGRWWDVVHHPDGLPPVLRDDSRDLPLAIAAIHGARQRARRDAI